MAWTPLPRRGKRDPAGSQDQHNHQTTRLGTGKHEGPGPVVCVMELASMLAGERFSDRPASVCPVIGSILRAYNDVVDDSRRHDLYRYAAEAVGTRGDFTLQHRRAAMAISWARPGHESRARRWVGLRNPPAEPDPDAGPDGVAEYVVSSLPARHSDEEHAGMIWLLDELIALPTATTMDELEAPVHNAAELWVELEAPAVTGMCAAVEFELPLAPVGDSPGRAERPPGPTHSVAEYARRGEAPPPPPTGPISEWFERPVPDLGQWAPAGVA